MRFLTWIVRRTLFWKNNEIFVTAAVPAFRFKVPEVEIKETEEKSENEKITKSF